MYKYKHLVIYYEDDIVALLTYISIFVRTWYCYTIHCEQNDPRTNNRKKGCLLNDMPPKIITSYKTIVSFVFPHIHSHKDKVKIKKFNP